VAHFKVTAFYGLDRGSFNIVGNFEADTGELAILAARLTGRSRKGRLEAAEISKEQAEREEREELEHKARQSFGARPPTPQQARLAHYHEKRLQNKMAGLTRNVEQSAIRGGSTNEVYRIAQKIEDEHRAKHG
jgi:hypothetical protein